jgi:hypothetical protein
MPSASTNNSRNRYFPKMRQYSRKWDFYDAQPVAVREWFQQLPINVWPGSFGAISASDMAEAERRHLAGLIDIWGPDHPAVIDAAKRIQVKGKRIVETLSTSDLEGLF